MNQEGVKMNKENKVMIKPVGDRVVVRRKKPMDTTVGGIIIPDAAQDKPSEGIVVATGDGIIVSEGDTVIFGTYSGTEISIMDESFVIMSEEDVLAVLL